jgi:hypothetical protein
MLLKNSTVEQNFKDSLTGIYISSVLLILLLIFIIYFLCLFCKRKRKLLKLKSNAAAVVGSLAKIDQHSENQLLTTINETIHENNESFDDNICQNRKNSEHIEFLLSKHSDSQSIGGFHSRQSSIFLNKNRGSLNKNQLLNSKVSLILLSSVISQDNLLNTESKQSSKLDCFDNDPSIDKDLSIILNNLLNKNTLDKKTANKLSDTIAKYYSNRRKLYGSLSSDGKLSMYRSKSISSLNTLNQSQNKMISFNKNISSNNHRRVSSEKCTRSYKKYPNNKQTNRNFLSVSPDLNNGKFKRQWASERHKLKSNDSYRTNSFNNIMCVASDSQLKASSRNKSKNNKPTTIYELYKANKLHVSSLFDES